MAQDLPPVEVYPEGQDPEASGVTLGGPSQSATDPDTGVSLGGPSQLSVPPAISTERAKKIQEGVGEHLQKSTDEIRSEIQQGNENMLRFQAAAAQDQQKAQQKQQMIIDLANQKGGPLDENEAARILDPFNPDNKPVDPNSVVEKGYGTSYIGSIEQAIAANPGNPVEEAKNEIPDQVDDAYLKGSDLVAKMEGLRKIREDLETQISNQSWPGYIADQLKQMWQPYNEYELRGLVPQVGSVTGGIMLGNNLEAQGDKVFSMPTEQALKTAKDVTDALAKNNPSLAHRWISYVEGLSSTDRVLDNTFTLIAPFDYAALGRGGLNLARKISLHNRTNIAVRQLVQDADRIGTDQAARLEAAGDTGGAAEKRASDIILQNIQNTGDPVKVATDDTLLTFLNQDKSKIATAPGNLKNWGVTAIMDQYDAAGKGLVQRILDATRINRIPMALATQNAVSIIRNAVRDYYPGIRNAILDVSDPLYEPRSNTYWHEITFGNYGGKLFSNPDTAKNFAKMNGLDDVDIVEGHGLVSNAKTEKMLADKATLEKSIAETEQTIIRRKAVAADPKATPQDRAAAKDDAAFFADQIKLRQQKIDDLGLRLKGNETYDRVKQLQSEIDQFNIRNKELNTSLRNKKSNVNDVDRERIQASIQFAKEQVKAKAQEINAIREGNTSVIGKRDTVEQHGVGFKIVVRRPLVETDRAVRDLMIRDHNGNLIPEATSTASSTGFKSILNSAIGKFRGADDTLALNESIQRKIGTYTQNLFKEWAYQEAKYIKQIASGVIRKDPVTGENIPYWRAKPAAIYNKLTGQVHKTYNEFTRTLDFARDARDPQTGKPGYFFQTPAELENHYRTYYGRPPDFAEHQAYFAFVRMVEGDRIMREVSEFRNRARLGIEQHQISARGPDGKMARSGFFDGRVRKEFPGGDDVLMITGRRLGDEKLVNLGGAGITPKKLEEYKEAVRLGKMKVIEIYAPEYTPLRQYSDVAGNEVVRYVLTDSAESKPIEFNHVNRRGGGHFEYDYDYYLKQPKMYHQYLSGTRGRYKSTYLGDTTFMPLLNRVIGRDVASKMHTIQKLIREGNLDEAKRFTEAHLPIEFNDLHSMFKPGRDADGKETRPLLDLNENFYVVSKGRSVLDTGKDLEEKYGKYFKDATKSGSLNRQFQVAFNTERESEGLSHLEDIGTAGNPIYKYAPEPKMIDPITTMNRSLNRIVNSVFMDDYKMYAVEHWLREAENYLKADITSIRAAPFWHFEQAQDKSFFKSDVSQEAISNLLSNRYKIKQFVGIPSSFDTQMNSAIQKLSDAAYESFGPKEGRSILNKAVTVLPLNLLARIKDPVTFIRSLTFHEKLGLFNPGQLLVQAQTFATILALHPQYAVQGTIATLLHQWYRINPSMLPTLDRLASKMGWRPGEFTESINLLSKTGFDHVAGEYANLNTALKTDFVGNDFKSILNAGTFFFREGERSTRLGAWHTAYKEFRDLNPTGAVSKDDLGKILQKADLLTANMSRASNSALQSGAFSLSTQFMTYQFRTAEMMLGKRITPMQKFRMLTFYSLLYGAPSAIGLSGLPLTTSIRQEAIERGYTVGDNWLSTAIDQGLPAIAAAYITGGGNFQKGNNYNYGNRYGSPGFTQFYDDLKSSNAWWALLGGAAGTSLLNTLTSTNNFFHAMASMLNPNNKDKAFPLKLDDFVDIFKEISTVNQTWKLIAAINTGKWMSKNENYIGNVTKANAFYMALTGVSPQQQDDSYIKANIKSAEVEYQKYIMKNAVEEYRRGLQAAHDHDTDQAKKYFTRAFTMLEIGGYPTDKKSQFLAIANKGYESRIDSEDYSFAFKNVPKTKSTLLGISTPFTTQSDVEATRREQFRETQKLNQLKGQ